MAFVTVICVVSVAVYLYWRIIWKPYVYFKNKNVPHVKPQPLFGNVARFIFQKMSLAWCLDEIYSSHPDARYVGFHTFLQPVILMRDPELIKTVTVKNWQSTSQHLVVVPETVDPLWGFSVVAMKGNEMWRQMRSILSFAFTSCKLKTMFGLMKNCSQQFLEHVEKNDSKIVHVDVRELFSKYANDVIGSTAFGFSCNSFEQPKNDFYTMGKIATNFEGFQSLKFLLNGISPYLMTILNIRIYSSAVRNFFYNIIKETLNKRMKYNIIRPDMLNLMLNAKRKGILDNQDEIPTYEEVNGKVKDGETQKLVINDDIITAQALIFFIGGFDSTATVMSFTSYELACNLDIQETLRSEVDAAYESCDGELTYDALSNLKYLDMVVSESLRKWPSILISDRAVVKPHTLEAHEDGAPPIMIDTDACYAIPIFSIHRDPKYYPNPEKFDPERFSEENKTNIKPYTYLPFGSGPRSCIGSRFAILEIKLIIAEIVHKYEIVPVAETLIPMKLSARGFLLRPNRSIILGFKKRQ